ncbi:MAG: SDR family NAD(P)-dependent oxidoreductase [Chlorobi bacterium]|nr:SDR family NAD(P)-dependent oxidoreductase [Chlorobiota bacterium]
MLALVTGGAGFIGSHTVDALLQRGYDVRILDNLQKPVHLKGKPPYLSDNAEFILGDVRSKEDVRKALRGVDVVFHFAAYQDYLPDFSTFFHVNAVGTALLYEIIVEDHLPVKKVVVASSQFVNGEGLYKTLDGNLVVPGPRPAEQLDRGVFDHLDEQGRPMQWQWTPESVTSPPNQYALSKHAQELMTLTLGKRYGIPSVALRYSIVQGARQSFYNAYSGACRIFSLHYYFDRSPTIYEDGKQCRDFVNIHDVVDANMLVLEDDRANYQQFCVGGGRAYTLLEFDRIVAGVFGKEHITPRIPGEYRFGDTRNACSDSSKLRELGWSPKRTADDSVREYAEYLQQQENIEDILEYAETTMKKLNVVRATHKSGDE